MKNILYIGNPKSIHDIKWASFFSAKERDYKVYFIAEKEVCNDLHFFSKQLKEKNIHLLDSIDSFSFSKPLQTVKGILYLKKIITKYKIDVVHILFSAPFSLWANFIPKPIIITNRGSDILIEIPKLLQQGLKGKLFFNLFARVFRKSVLTATSQKQIEQIDKLFKLNATLIRTGVDVKHIEKLTQRVVREKIIFSPRYFSPIYNIKLQIDAIRLLPKEILNDYQFIFIKGKNPDLNYVAKLEEELVYLEKERQLKYRVITSLKQEEMFIQYGKSALTIMTPLSDGTPNSALEAMAAKCPLIVPNLDYDFQLFNNTCEILQTNNAIDLAKLMQDSLVNYDKNVTENAFEAVSKYGNRDVEMKKLEALYKSM